MKKQYFYHLGIILYTFVLMFLMFAIVKSLHSLFLVPVTESLHMQRSEFSLIFSISGLSVAFAIPIVTKLIQKYPAKWVISVCILMVAGGFSAYSLATKSWHFYLIALIVGAGTAGCTNMVASLLINNWFQDRKGLALGVAFTGSGFGAAIISPIMTNFLETYGWQFSYVFFGLLMGAVCLPLTWLLAYKKPVEKGVKPYQAKNSADEEIDGIREIEEKGLLLKNIKIKPFFWMYMMALGICSLAIGGVHIHIAAYLTDIGHTATFVGIVYSLQAFCVIGGKLGLGAIFDAKGSRAGILFMGATFTAAMLCLFMAKQPVMAIMFALFYGCGSTFTSVGIPYLTGSMFGQKDYAEIFSMVNVVYVLGAAFGPFLTGKVYDITGEYLLIWKIELVLFIISVGVLWWLKGYLEQHYHDELN